MWFNETFSHSQTECLLFKNVCVFDNVQRILNYSYEHKEQKIKKVTPLSLLKQLFLISSMAQSEGVKFERHQHLSGRGGLIKDDVELHY